MLQGMGNTGPLFVIADNHTCDVRSTKWQLERLLGTNIEVITGQNGEDAIKLFDEVVSSGNHDRLMAVFVGCHMPKLSGHQAAALMRNIERENNISRPVAIIGTTTYLNNVTHAEFIEAGANAVLEKPVAGGELEVLITAIIEDFNL